MRQVQQARGPGHSFVMATLLLKAQNVRHNIRLILGGDDEVGHVPVGRRARNDMSDNAGMGCRRHLPKRGRHQTPDRRRPHGAER